MWERVLVDCYSVWQVKDLSCSQLFHRLIKISRSLFYWFCLCTLCISHFILTVKKNIKLASKTGIPVPKKRINMYEGEKKWINNNNKKTLGGKRVSRGCQKSSDTPSYEIFKKIKLSSLTNKRQYSKEILSSRASVNELVSCQHLQTILPLQNSDRLQ